MFTRQINASKRLLKRIKEEFPKLKICILGDSLYAVESIIGTMSRKSTIENEKFFGI